MISYSLSKQVSTYSVQASSLPGSLTIQENKNRRQFYSAFLFSLTYPPLNRQLLPTTVTSASLQDREQVQDVQEQVQHCDKDRDRQPDSIGHRIRHIFGSLYIE